MPGTDYGLFACNNMCTELSPFLSVFTVLFSSCQFAYSIMPLVGCSSASPHSVWLLQGSALGLHCAPCTLPWVITANVVDFTTTSITMTPNYTSLPQNCPSVRSCIPNPSDKSASISSRHDILNTSFESLSHLITLHFHQQHHCSPLTVPWG